MVTVHTSPSEPIYLYELVPSTALPIVDLSQSLKSRYLPPAVLRAFDSFLRRWKLPLAICYALSLVLTAVVLYVDASTGRVLSVLTLLFGLPLGLGGLGALRFEMVRLLVREDSVIFFGLLNVATQLLTGTLLGDLRALYLVNVSLGFMNAVLIDARLRAVRWFTGLCVVAWLVSSTCLVAFSLKKVDQVNDLILWQYQEGTAVFDVCISEYVTTGLFTLVILLAKTVFRKLRSLRDPSRACLIECVMFQCRIQLVPSSQRGPSLPLGCNPGSSTTIQQLTLAHTGFQYDARNVLLPMAFIVSAKPFPGLFLLVLYALGFTGFAMFSISSQQGSTTTVDSVVIFTSSLGFWLVFATCYQRDLLRSLLSSFDFLFYSTQITTILYTGACIGQWEPNRCLWLLTSWIWAHWVFCLDALTPLMKTKLRFRVWYAVPILLVQSFGGVVFLYGVFTTRQNLPVNSVLWSGRLFGYNLRQNLLPFLVDRMLIACTWTIRLLVRLCRASNADAIILKGAVSYENYLSRSAQLNQRAASRVRFRSLKSAMSRIHPKVPHRA